MLQQRKKDYLQRLIEEFFKKLAQIINNQTDDMDEKKEVINDCFQFFFDNFDIKQEDSAEDIINKTQDFELSEQYAKLMLISYKDEPQKVDLHKALSIVEILQNTDTSFSWSRNTLKQDILSELDEN